MLVSQRIEQELRQLVANREKGTCSRRNRLPAIGAVLSAVSATLLANVRQKPGSKDTPSLWLNQFSKRRKIPTENEIRDLKPYRKSQIQALNRSRVEVWQTMYRNPWTLHRVMILGVENRIVLIGEIVSMIIFSRRRAGIYPPIEGQQENHYCDNQNPQCNRPLPQKVQLATANQQSATQIIFQ